MSIAFWVNKNSRRTPWMETQLGPHSKVQSTSVVEKGSRPGFVNKVIHPEGPSSLCYKYKAMSVSPFLIKLPPLLYGVKMGLQQPSPQAILPLSRSATLHTGPGLNPIWVFLPGCIRIPATLSGHIAFCFNNVITNLTKDRVICSTWLHSSFIQIRHLWN